MGKQVNFYMTQEDERDFVEFVRSDRNVGILTYTSPINALPLVEELPNRNEHFGGHTFLWDMDNSPRPVQEYIPTQKYYLVDEINSEVIEFSRSNINEGRLVRGRIWAEMVVWNTEGTMRPKSESFQKWFDRLANWIKRHGERNKFGEYVFPGAAQYAKQGGKLVDAVYADSVKYFRHDIEEKE
jgi:hypothetical protein